jgi:hypothetical protein
MVTYRFHDGLLFGAIIGFLLGGFFMVFVGCFLE